MVFRNDKEYKEAIGNIERETIERITNQTEGKSIQTSFPFSKMVPGCIQVIRRFIDTITHFASGRIELPDMDRLMMKITKDILIDMAKTYVKLVCESKEVTLTQASVAYINISYMEKTIPIFENDLVLLVGEHVNVKLTQDTQEPFVQSYKSLEAKFFEIVECLVDRILDKAKETIAWNPEKPPKDPKSFVLEIVEFASETLPKQMTIIPRDIVLKLYRHFYTLIARKYIRFLLDDSVIQFNRHCAKGLLTDLTLIEEAATKAPVKGIVENFEETHQLFVLLSCDNLREFMDPKIQSSKYSKLSDFKKILAIFEKYMENSGLASRFNIGFLQDDRTKQIEAVRAYLRANMK
eukprot:TRINITY_DN399_c0_g3_i4.p1 TRINITY_DN399_c0_g3~~TRINITY_DN399_c0_g3_i4.p1  ORF type:complete len:351 (-),score=73.80 TRINITY_DN399_c0_g3_i4:42-1094(-)